MKKTLSLLLTLILLISVSYTAFAIDDSEYWKNSTSSLGNHIISDNNEDLGKESFIIIYYSTGCSNSMKLLSTFEKYGKDNKIHTYAINYNKSRGFEARKFTNSSVLNFPIAVVYNHNSDEFYAIDKISEAKTFKNFADQSLAHAFDKISLTIGKNEMKIGSKSVTLDVAPQIIDGRTMIPLRAIFEALGADVTWYEQSQTIVAKKRGKQVQLAIDSPSMRIYGMEDSTDITLDVAPQIINSRTLVPVRAVSEAFFRTVNWNDKTQTVTIE
ncbi:MAG: copper amine oxidase N-terminal domain-containing protein [Clostridia bacterium]|nr:copper amine oxidase N-terminal domain-containing protein [Clostridia bacterium]